MAILMRASIVAIASLTATALAQPPPDGTTLPGEESGRVDQPEEGEGLGTQLLRGLLFIPRTAVQVLLLPVKGFVYVYDRYQLDERYYNTFYTADREFGVVPTATYATGLGFTAGAEVVATNLFGESEHLNVLATYGGNYRSDSGLWIDSGKRFAPFKIQAGGNFTRRPTEPFYGYGNNNLGPPPLMPANPQDLAFKSQMRYQEARAQLSGGAYLGSGLIAIVRGTYTDLKYGPPTSGAPLEDVFMQNEVTAFDTGAETLRGDGELRWDTRHHVSDWEPAYYHSEGTLADIFGGYTAVISGEGQNFWRYGFDLQQFVRFASGPRGLELRVFGEAVSGNVNQVPFTELPMLGGDFLRGYQYGRFRDRVSAFATIQYFWDISKYVEAFVFTDIGRVFPSLSDLTVDDLRAGFGGGISLHTNASFVFEGYLASSIDGGVVVSAVFVPIFDQRPRWR